MADFNISYSVNSVFDKRRRSKLNRTTQNCTVYETGRRNLPNEQPAFQKKKKKIWLEWNLSTPSKLTALWQQKKRLKESYLHGPFAKLGSSPSPSSQLEKIRGGQTFLKSANRKSANQILGLIRYPKSANIFDLSAQRKSVNVCKIQYCTLYNSVSKQS